VTKGILNVEDIVLASGYFPKLIPAPLSELSSDSPLKGTDYFLRQTKNGGQSNKKRQQILCVHYVLGTVLNNPHSLSHLMENIK
jgi:hypothetical protein